MKWFYPFVVSLSGVLFSFPFNKNKPEAHIVPQFRANHPVNAAGCVEKIRCVLMEWATPIANLTNQESYRLTRDVFRNIIVKMTKRFNDFKLVNPYKALPISLFTELRILKSSDNLISPSNKRIGPSELIGAPECVSHSLGNQWYEIFIQEIHNDIKAFFKPNEAVLVHLGKGGWNFDKFLSFIRTEYDKMPKTNGNSPLVAFNLQRKIADPKNIFLTPFFEQLLTTINPTYVPIGTKINTNGGFRILIVF